VNKKGTQALYFKQGNQFRGVGLRFFHCPHNCMYYNMYLYDCFPTLLETRVSGNFQKPPSGR